MTAEPFDWFDLDTWPTWARRVFLLTLPVSGPLWLASLVLLIAALAVGFTIAGFALAIGTFGWAIVAAVGRFVSDLWSPRNG